MADLRRGYVVAGTVLVIVGIVGLALLRNLAMAYLAKPDAPNGGIVLQSQFIHISYSAALGGVLAAILLLLAGLALAIIGYRRPATVTVGNLA